MFTLIIKLRALFMKGFLTRIQANESRSSPLLERVLYQATTNNKKQLLDEVFVIPGIIKVEVSVIG